MTQVSILSACFGGYDSPTPVPTQTVEHEAVLVTDSITQIKGWKSKIWEPKTVDIRTASKRVKCQPMRCVSDNADVVVWMDAQFIIKSPKFIEWCLTSLGKSQIALMEHVHSSSISEEATRGRGPAGRGRFTTMDTLGQVHSYIDSGHPDDWGMYHSGLMIYRTNPKVIAMLDDWLAEQEQWSTQDEISLPYVIKKHLNRRPKKIDHPGWKNEFWDLKVRGRD